MQRGDLGGGRRGRWETQKGETFGRSRDLVVDEAQKG